MVGKLTENMFHSTSEHGHLVEEREGRGGEGGGRGGGNEEGKQREGESW